ncbi:protein kinase 4 [Contarinia nasturtii]|uniref:protein kinase 4 n=1 Tax=Contarinia nasturtii TaxID=265458 RepID=UPI0012D4B02E|nr:protein kinase 4 [Contarinia nasturtii]XP_031616606.1 protein kinase 4 [Contarinia nasturtii]
MAASVYGGSPAHHNRIVHNSNGLPNSHNQIMADSLSHGHSTFYHDPASYLPHQNFTSLKHSTALSSIFVAPPPVPPHQIPPLPKKTKKNYRTISGGTVIHSGMVTDQQQNFVRNTKRKSAVELLAESKPYYVKSENVLDKKQQLLYQSMRTPFATKSNTNTNLPPSSACLISPSHTFPHQRASHTLNNRRSVSANSELLQIKLRRLINDSSSPKDSVFDSYVLASQQKNRRPSFDYEHTKFDPPQQFSSPKRFNQELIIHPVSDLSNDNDVMFPSAFLSPQSLPSTNTTFDDIYCDYKSSSILSDYQPISPPAEYAEFNDSPIHQRSHRKDTNRSVNYQRSYSHSQTVDIEEPDYESPTHNKINHKSLPDLHTHTQTNRNSPYSEYSEGRGNRSNKSNSSLNRDSGGSSGHYTHRSEPFYKQEPHKMPQSKHNKPYSNFQQQQQQQQQQQKYYGPDNRRDSGSSTQHSGNSYYNAYGGVTSRIDCIECDNNQSPTDANCLLNFTTSVVPEAFQDHFSDNDNDKDINEKSKQYVDEPILRASRASIFYNNTRNYEPDLQGMSIPLPSNDLLSPIEGEISPPLGTFKRQKCFRIKQHPSRHPSPSDRISNAVAMDDRKPILRSKSDISHRYFSRNVQKNDSMYLPENGTINEQQRAKSENFTELERFFDRLGLSDDYNNSTDSNRSSPVFFSDVATVDSDQLPDSTETQLETQPYRPIEPARTQTSIVERNARIIKWLCTCRKMQVT